MSNSFNKEEKVAFGDILKGFDDYLVMSQNVEKYNMDATDAERSNDQIWRPQPYIAQSNDGADQTGNFGDATQLAVPASIGFRKVSPWTMTAKELRDAMQSDRLGKAAQQKLASDVNVAVTNVATQQGTLVVAVPGAATGYDDVALADSMMNEQGISHYDRYMALASRDYNAMASNLAARQTIKDSEMTGKAYKKSYVGEVAGFETFKVDYTNRIAAAAGGAGITIDTQVGAGNFYEPKATSTATTGETANVDNRTASVTVSSTAGVAAGDCFTTAGVEAVHHITKQPTGQLKTFRVMSVDSGTTMTVSPPIISNQGSTEAEARYQNVEVTESATAAIVFLNTTIATANPFWCKGAIELIPGTLGVPMDAGAGVMRGTTENGIEVTWQKQYDINTAKTKYRLDIHFGVVNLQPEMTGIMLFNQA